MDDVVVAERTFDLLLRGDSVPIQAEAALSHKTPHVGLCRSEAAPYNERGKILHLASRNLDFLGVRKLRLELILRHPC